MIIDNQKHMISRLLNGEGMARIGSIWFGNDDTSTVTSIYYFGNKKIKTVLPIRAETALSFSDGTPPVDSLQIEIVVKNTGFREYIQKFFAQLQISRVLPVINPTIAAITTPMQTNKDIYSAYGYGMYVNDSSILSGSNPESSNLLFRMYCTVPVQMRVDQAMLGSIKGAPGSFRLLITLTRALTSNIYGDRVKYIKSMPDAITQENYLRKYSGYIGDDEKTKAMSRMFGAPVTKYEYMLSEMKRVTEGNLNTKVTGNQYLIEKVISPTLYYASDRSGNRIYMAPYGAEGLMSKKSAEMFGISEKALLTVYNKKIISDNDYKCKMLTDLFKETGYVDIIEIERSGISFHDGVLNETDGIKISYSLMHVPAIGDLSNHLIKTGMAFTSPTYNESKMSPEYRKARKEIISDITGSVYTDEFNLNHIRSRGDVKYPWEDRKTLRLQEINK